VYSSIAAIGMVLAKRRAWLNPSPSTTHSPQHFGRSTWKQTLRDAWTNSTLYQHIEPHHVAPLQQLRNTIGTAGLAKVRL